MALGDLLEPNRVAIYFKEGKEAGFVIEWVPLRWKMLSSTLEYLDVLSGHRFCNNRLFSWSERRGFLKAKRVDIPSTPDVFDKFRTTFGWEKVEYHDD